MANNKRSTKAVSAREEVIADTINAIRKRIIQLQLESEFATKFLEANGEIGTSEAKAKFIESIELMKKEEMAMIAKLHFYKEKRLELTAKKAMKGYDKFPKTMNLENATCISEDK